MSFHIFHIKEPEGEIPNLQPKETKFRCAEHQIEEKEVFKLLLDFSKVFDTTRQKIITQVK